jgi:hypothetical protein
MTRYAARKDHTHRGIRLAFEQMGFLVMEGTTIDFTLYDPQTGLIHLVDAKTSRRDGGKGTKTDAQAAMVKNGWPIAFPQSIEDAVALATKWRRL